MSSSTFIIEISPKKPEFDPLASHIQTSLVEMGEAPAKASVQTRRLFRLEGSLSSADVEKIAETLLVDPIVETATVKSLSLTSEKSKKDKSSIKGTIVDIWPKPGVTDPVGETVEKGIQDLGLFTSIKATSASRFVFPKLTDSKNIQQLSKRVLANELIHDIDIRTTT